MAKKEQRKRLLVWMSLLAAVAVAWWSVTYVPPAVEPTIEEEEVAEETTTSAPAALPTRTSDGKLIIRYYNSGFSPFITEVAKGETVQFVNQSDAPLWVTTDNHPTAKQQQLTELDFDKSISAGETYDFVANEQGSWGFYNLNNRDHLGTLVIIQ